MAFKHNTLFSNCILKTNNTLIDNAEDLDIEAPMHNLIEYSKNFSKTTGSLWNNYKGDPNRRYKLFDYSVQYLLIIKQVLQKNSKVAKQEKNLILMCVPLKYLSNF